MRANYLARAERNPVQYRMIDASVAQAEVCQQIQAVLDEVIKQRIAQQVLPIAQDGE